VVGAITKTATNGQLNMQGTASIEEFRKIYFEDYGVELTPAEATETAANFLTGFKAVVSQNSVLTTREEKKYGSE